MENSITLLRPQPMPPWNHSSTPEREAPPPSDDDRPSRAQRKRHREEDVAPTSSTSANHQVQTEDSSAAAAFNPKRAASTRSSDDRPSRAQLKRHKGEEATPTPSTSANHQVQTDDFSATATLNPDIGTSGSEDEEIVPEEDIRLNEDSISKILGVVQREVMVYGVRYARYQSVERCLSKTIPYVHSWSIAGGDTFCQVTQRYFIRTMDAETSDEKTVPMASLCKGALMSWVLENYQRRRTGIAFIPLLFCIGSNNPAREAFREGPRALSAQVITSRDPIFNERISVREVRRMYKLYHELAQTTEYPLRLISWIFRKTVIWVTVDQRTDNPDVYELNHAQAPWEHEDWGKLWEQRISTRTRSEYPQKWLQDLKNKIEQINTRAPRAF